MRDRREAAAGGKENMDALNTLQMVTVVLLYGTSLGSFLVLAGLWCFGRLPHWIAAYYSGAVLLCGFGWEFWFAYGWGGGASIAERRTAQMNELIPPWFNGVGNAMGDAFGIAVVGLVLVWLLCGAAAFDRWKWSALTVLLVWFVGENILIELTVYQAQLTSGAVLSWAPFSPFGNAWNPQLLDICGRTVHLQTQLPWVVMTPILYALAIVCKRRWPPAAGCLNT